MPFIRGTHGSGSRVETEYFEVTINLATGGCISWLHDAPTRRIAYREMWRRFDCPEQPVASVELRRICRDTYADLGGFEPRPPVTFGLSRVEPLCDRG